MHAMTPVLPSFVLHEQIFATSRPDARFNGTREHLQDYRDLSIASFDSDMGLYQGAHLPLAQSRIVYQDHQLSSQAECNDGGLLSMNAA